MHLRREVQSLTVQLSAAQRARSSSSCSSAASAHSRSASNADLFSNRSGSSSAFSGSQSPLNVASLSVPTTPAVLGEARVRLAKHKRARTEGGGCCRSSRSPTATEKAVLQMDKVSAQRLPTSLLATSVQLYIL
jgi:hypothetical protein